MYRRPGRPSPSALRSAATLTLRLLSSTMVLGQTRAVSSSLVTSSPGRSTSAARISRARLPRRTSVSPSAAGVALDGSGKGQTSGTLTSLAARPPQSAWCSPGRRQTGPPGDGAFGNALASAVTWAIVAPVFGRELSRNRSLRGHIGPDAKCSLLGAADACLACLVSRAGHFIHRHPPFGLWPANVVWHHGLVALMVVR